MSNQGPVLARVLGQQPRRPYLVRIAELLGLAASKIDQPSPCLHRNHGLTPRSRAVLPRRQRAMRYRPLDAALHRLMMHAQRTTHREERRIVPVRQQHPRPRHAPCRFRPRPRDRSQLRQFLPTDCQLYHSPRRRHDYLLAHRRPFPYHM
jgi:hypothetical protein